MPPTDPRTRLLVAMLDSVFDGRSWHGTTLRGSIRRLGVAEALWRPGPKRHCIWELVLHTAYWKYVTHRLLTGGGRGAFPRVGSDWPRLPEQRDAAAWRADVALLVAQHRQLHEAVAAFPAARLGRRPRHRKWTFAEQIAGVVAHDGYHAGQIQLIKRLRAGEA